MKTREADVREDPFRPENDAYQEFSDRSFKAAHNTFFRAKEKFFATKENPQFGEVTGIARDRFDKVSELTKDVKCPFSACSFAAKARTKVHGVEKVVFADMAKHLQSAHKEDYLAILSSQGHNNGYRFDSSIGESHWLVIWCFANRDLCVMAAKKARAATNKHAVLPPALQDAFANDNAVVPPLAITQSMPSVMQNPSVDGKTSNPSTTERSPAVFDYSNTACFNWLCSLLRGMAAEEAWKNNIWKRFKNVNKLPVACVFCNDAATDIHHSLAVRDCIRKILKEDMGGIYASDIKREYDAGNQGLFYKCAFLLDAYHKSLGSRGGVPLCKRCHRIASDLEIEKYQSRYAEAKSNV